jgi:hypothetical protein
MWKLETYIIDREAALRAENERYYDAITDVMDDLPQDGPLYARLAEALGRDSHLNRAEEGPWGVTLTEGSVYLAIGNSRDKDGKPWCWVTAYPLKSDGGVDLSCPKVVLGPIPVFKLIGAERK